MKVYGKGALLGIALMGLVACGGGDKKDGGSAPDGGDKADTAAKDDGGDKAPYDAAAHKGSVSGTIKFAGEVPEKVLFNVASDAFCADQWKGKEAIDEQFVVNADSSLPNVFVYAKTGPHKSFTGYKAPEGFVVSQKDCYYIPHVFGVMKGQKFTVKNDDQTMHNVNVKPSRNDSANKAQAPGGSDDFTFTKTEKKIPFSCDVHSWMSATAWCMSHPFFATTDASGKFEIKGLPDGKYTFVAWHENFGETEFEVEISGGAATADATIDG